MEHLLFYTHHTINLICGIILTIAFCDIPFNKKNCLKTFSIFAICGFLELCTFFLTKGNEIILWELYPLVVHFPLFILVCIFFKKKVSTSIVSVCVAYLCCQPSNWFGLLTDLLCDNIIIYWCIKIFVSLLTTLIVFIYFAPSIAKIFNKDTRSVLVFGSIPLFYYLFDYIVTIYTDIWMHYYQLASELLSLSLCIFFIIFCFVYYKEYEQKLEAQHREDINRIIQAQQTKEIETIKQSNFETSILRHDMRLMLNTLALCIEQNDKETALKTISGFVNQVNATSIQRYCDNDTLNYILTHYKQRCINQNIKFITNVEIDSLSVDEILFASIISNALDNAFNAQLELPIEQRQIKLMLRQNHQKLLLSVKNPYFKEPHFIEHFPSTTQNGHGYGTQSILYMTEKLNGKCQFSIQDNQFIVRVVL